ncbi:MAG: hypothetical protein HN576_01195 [Bacteriovoracaceae bacterium]|jgi:hypothetical protein|nr:hypothetical protein [Bacteriovoracaceae bacterium]
MNALEEAIDGLQFLQKLITVYEQGELDFWEDRLNPPNLTKDEFDLVLYRIDRANRLSWVTRESEEGPHGTTGEDDCFKFNCSAEFGGIFENETKTFFVKGYFFDKGDLKGVTIQSFRED